MSEHIPSAPRPATKRLPAPNGDFFDLFSLLSEEDNAIRLKVRHFMETEVAPIANHYWTEGEFPFELIPKFATLGLMGLPFHGYDCPGKSFLLEGIVAMEMARVDCSIATFFGVQNSLAMASIYHCGGEEQKAYWLPKMHRLETIGSFALTEPEVGSSIARDMMTTCKREGDTWIINGQKRWIGNAPFADIHIVWARDVENNHIKGFIVPKETPGVRSVRMDGKIALRIVQNGDIFLENVRIAEENRLQKSTTFAGTARVLRAARVGVSWFAAGCSMGAYEHCLKYAQTRHQFGKAIGNYQLVQSLLVQMLGNITAAQTMCFRLGQMQDAGTLKDEHASLAKAYTTVGMRETVGWARELFGGNGILVEHNVARFVADAEAIYSYEGTREMNTLIVGRAITGFSAFV
jgi:glutaryl-CoA dehydrogenase